MPYLISSGAATANNVQVPMSILARLNLGGQCISVGKEYAEPQGRRRHQRLQARAGGQGGQDRRREGRDDLPGGTHDMWIRYWLAAGGIDPNKDISRSWCRRRRWWPT
jgi:nitrate/nitrite transport system substrate-binding protein